MTFQDLQIHDPQGAAEAVAEGVQRERSRVAALLAMRQDPRFSRIEAIVQVFDTAIGDGSTVEQASALLLNVLSRNSTQAALESPGPLGTGHVDTAIGEAAGKGAEARQPVTEV